MRQVSRSEAPTPPTASSQVVSIRPFSISNYSIHCSVCVCVCMYVSSFSSLSWSYGGPAPTVLGVCVCGCGCVCVSVCMYVSSFSSLSWSYGGPAPTVQARRMYPSASCPGLPTQLFFCSLYMYMYPWDWQPDNQSVFPIHQGLDFVVPVIVNKITRFTNWHVYGHKL